VSVKLTGKKKAHGGYSDEEQEYSDDYNEYNTYDVIMDKYKWSFVSID